VTAGPLYPPTIIYGHEPPNIRFRWQGGTQTYFCLNNGNLHLTDDQFDLGTFEAGAFLGPLCDKHCRPAREDDRRPCPAFVKSCKAMPEERGGLAEVVMRPVPDWEQCAGVAKVLSMAQTEEERFFLRAYLEDKYGDESKWRDGLVAQWNEGWKRVENGWGRSSRRSKFDQMMWWTVRFPALIPQVWLNWLHAAPEEVLGALDDNPSRVDFVAFAHGERHAIEIDGPSHYADFDEVSRSYSVNEKAYARNLKIERSLRSEEWVVTRIGRQEVRQAMDEDDDFGGFFARSVLLGILPFYKNEEYPPQLAAAHLGVPEIENSFADVFGNANDDDIPF
jgi:hypothetical protein